MKKSLVAINGGSDRSLLISVFVIKLCSRVKN